jgi:hypothetical protein
MASGSHMYHLLTQITPLIVLTECICPSYDSHNNNYNLVEHQLLGLQSGDNILPGRQINSETLLTKVSEFTCLLFIFL